MKKISDTSYRENQNTHFMFSNFFPENHEVYEIMWQNMVIIIIAFPLQQWLGERALILRP
jgi:hypothetical protein